MKKLFFATLMCVAAMSAKAQVLTSETVNHVYEEVTNKAESNFAYNAEWTGKDITAMYVFKKDRGPKGLLSLKPHLKYEYAYASDGMLTSRVTYRWAEGQNDWVCTARHDYTLINDTYSAEYSRYNHAANRFDLPVEKMVYSLTPEVGVDYVSCYHRNYTSSQFKLVSEAIVSDMNRLFAMK
jgi:hypothetical protein